MEGSNENARNEQNTWELGPGSETSGFVEGLKLIETGQVFEGNNLYFECSLSHVNTNFCLVTYFLCLKIFTIYWMIGELAMTSLLICLEGLYVSFSNKR